MIIREALIEETEKSARVTYTASITIIIRLVLISFFPKTLITRE